MQGQAIESFIGNLRGFVCYVVITATLLLSDLPLVQNYTKNTRKTNINTVE